jgi:hypothetical protein
MGFQSGFRPKVLDERVRRVYVRQLIAQIDELDDSIYSSNESVEKLLDVYTRRKAEKEEAKITEALHGSMTPVSGSRNPSRIGVVGGTSSRRNHEGEKSAKFNSAKLDSQLVLHSESKVQSQPPSNDTEDAYVSNIEPDNTTTHTEDAYVSNIEPDNTTTHTEDASVLNGTYLFTHFIALI